MRSLVTALAFGLAILLAVPASANWNVKAKLVCYDDAVSENSTKLDVSKGKNVDIVAACLGVAPTDPSVAEHALVFDSDNRVLTVIRNCDEVPIICTIAVQESCATGYQESSSGYKLKQQCIYDVGDVGPNDADGTMICKESESNNETSGKFSFKTSCKANIDFEGQACTLSFGSGKLFEESAEACPL
jgi:hypothetical protein